MTGAVGAGVAAVRVAVASVGVADVGAVGKAETGLGDEVGDDGIAVDTDGAALGGVDATQPPTIEVNKNATVTRRAAGYRAVLMFFQTTERPRTFDLRGWAEHTFLT